MGGVFWVDEVVKAAIIIRAALVGKHLGASRWYLVDPPPNRSRGQAKAYGGKLLFWVIVVLPMVAKRNN